MSFAAVAVAGAVVGGVGAGFKIYQGVKQNSLANKINPQYELYKGSSAVGQNLATTQQAYSGRGAGFATAQDKILQAQGATLGNAGRNATDASQLLAITQGSQSQVDNSLVGLAAQEGQQKQGLLDNLQAAYGQKIADDRYVNQAILNKYQTDVGAKTALRGAGMQNISGGIGDISSLLALLGQQQAGVAKKAG